MAEGERFSGAITESDIEEWRPIPAFPDYSVSSWGRIRREPWRLDRIGRPYRGGVLKPNSYGYYVQLANSVGVFRVSIARTVLEVFVGPPPFPGALARHLDDNVRNTRLFNLAWGSHVDNIADAIRNGVPVGKYERTKDIRQKLRQRRLGTKQSGVTKERIKAGVLAAQAEGRVFRGHTQEQRLALGVARRRVYAEGRGRCKDPEAKSRKCSEAKKAYWEARRRASNG